jgi:hypothetical protein
VSDHGREGKVDGVRIGGREKRRYGTEKEDGRVNNLYKGILGVGIKGIK